ncbi:MAG: hypothetical protein KJP16_05260 [Gammaproteobacteria bacterium]|nr:hypothetical protein [Gammaproteobacteria bacterium]NNL50207.1 hypothetical protein [Woeseiaceae bacterium]
MDYFQGVVTEYLVADRAAFVNSELLIQLDLDEPKKGRHWYCDAAAVDIREETLYLCEVTYSKSMTGLSRRLLAWDEHWKELRNALARDCGIPESWQVQPWAFIPKGYDEALKSRIAPLSGIERGADAMPYPLITFLENVVPWNYVTWDRKVVALEIED